MSDFGAAAGAAFALALSQAVQEEAFRATTQEEVRVLPQKRPPRVRPSNNLARLLPQDLLERWPQPASASNTPMVPRKKQAKTKVFMISLSLVGKMIGFQTNGFLTAYQLFTLGKILTTLQYF